MDRESLIQIYRDNGFNCFPIPFGQKEADYRYKGSKTVPNQTIKDDENFGIIPIEGTGTCIIDFDDKERYRQFAQENIDIGFLVVESPNGWHIPIKGLTGTIHKIELFDYDVQDKKIVEFQGPDHYCIGPGSIVKGVEYRVKNDKIWDAKGMHFDTLLEKISKKCKVTGRSRSKSAYYRMRQDFKEGKPPQAGHSNDYFFQAALQCNTEGLTEIEALDRIKVIYEQWQSTDAFSGRPWANIEAKVTDVYKNDLKVTHGGDRRSKTKSRVDIATSLIREKQLYSTIETQTIYENKKGFLQIVNYEIMRELIRLDPEIEKADIDSIIFKLAGLADPVPPTNKDLIVFKNGILDKKTKQIIETEEIADMGFPEYDYLPSGKENEPVEFIKLLFDNVPENNIPRIKAMLKGAMSRYLDPKISVIHGKSGVGKSTPLTVLATVLGEYASNMELKQFLGDHFMRATLENKSLLVLQDLPKTWENFEILKTITGETTKSERGFQQDMKTFENKIKICGSSNYLATIPEEEKDAMFTRRLSLIQNIREVHYKEDTSFPQRLAESEGEKIISWIINLPDKECYYEDPLTVKEQWTKISSPEVEFVKNKLELVDRDEATHIEVMELVDQFIEENKTDISLKLMTAALKSRGFVVKYNQIENAKRRFVSQEVNQKIVS